MVIGGWLVKLFVNLKEDECKTTGLGSTPEWFMGIFIVARGGSSAVSCYLIVCCFVNVFAIVRTRALTARVI